jgi:RimJ/RimL family protein N-acetyltransferase
VERTAPSTLRTDRLEIRALRAGDGAALTTLYRANCDRFADSFPKTVAELVDPAAGERYVADRDAERSAGTGYWYGLWHAGTLVGQVQIKNVDRSAGRAELAYLVDGALEGRGLVAEAVRAILRVCFVDLALHKVYVRTIVANDRSEALARRFRFTLEGRLRQEHVTPRGRVDLHYFGLLASEWSASGHGAATSAR